MKGTIYTETVVYAAPAAFVNEAPYQLVIVTLDDGTRVTGRIEGDRVSIDDPVELVEHRAGVPWFRPANPPRAPEPTSHEFVTNRR
jgi:uncharacterized OB-fold protein